MIDEIIRERKEKREREFRHGVTWVQVGLIGAILWKVLKWVGMFFLIGAGVLIMGVAKMIFGTR